MRAARTRSVLRAHPSEAGPSDTRSPSSAADASLPFNATAAQYRLLRYRTRLRRCGSIPSTVHVTFARPQLLRASESPLIEQGLHQFRQLNPHWTVREWDDDAIDAYLRRHLHAQQYRMVARAHPVEKADLWRLVILCHEGGLYMDIDRLVNTPMSALIGPQTKMLLPVFRGFVPGNHSARRGDMHAARRSSTFCFSQDLMATAAGNPLHCAAADLNMAARAECRSPIRQVRGECTIMKLGPQLYMQGAMRMLFGTEGDRILQHTLARNGHSSRAFVGYALQALLPYALSRDELLPLHTLLYDGTRNTTPHRSWTTALIAKEKRRLYVRAGITHWARQPWWQLRVGRWLNLFA
jgi:hypothetical protein